MTGHLSAVITVEDSLQVYIQYASFNFPIFCVCRSHNNVPWWRHRGPLSDETESETRGQPAVTTKGKGRQSGVIYPLAHIRKNWRPGGTIRIPSLSYLQHLNTNFECHFSANHRCTMTTSQLQHPNSKATFAENIQF